MSKGDMGTSIQRLFPKLPSWFLGLIAAVTATAEFVLFYQGHFALLTCILLIAVWLGCLYLRFARTDPGVIGGRGTYAYPRIRDWALIGIGVVPTAALAFAMGAYWTRYELDSPRPEPTTEALPLYSQLIVVGWNALRDRDYRLTVSIAEVCIDAYEEQALLIQGELTSGGNPFPPLGKVSDDERNEIYSWAVLNEVATCYLLKGQALEELGLISEAKEAYMGTQQFPHARTWDPATEEFWSPAHVATQMLGKLP